MAAGNESKKTKKKKKKKRRASTMERVVGEEGGGGGGAEKLNKWKNIMATVTTSAVRDATFARGIASLPLPRRIPLFPLVYFFPWPASPPAAGKFSQSQYHRNCDSLELSRVEYQKRALPTAAEKTSPGKKQARYRRRKKKKKKSEKSGAAAASAAKNDVGGVRGFSLPRYMCVYVSPSSLANVSRQVMPRNARVCIYTQRAAAIR